jgi:hypothetical protein
MPLQDPEAFAPLVRPKQIPTDAGARCTLSGDVVHLSTRTARAQKPPPRDGFENLPGIHKPQK